MYDNCAILSLRFPQKLWRIVNDCKSGTIRWGSNGNTILLDYKKFQEQYLDPGNSIFKTKNITSFVRQLNLYGFRKVTSHNRDPICNSHNPDIHEFLHENFRAGRPDLLSTVCRKTAGKNKHRQQAISRNSAERDVLEKPEKQVSRLRMCRLALTKALEQIAQEYHQGRYKTARANDCCMNTSHYGESVVQLFGLNLYPVPTHGPGKWITKKPVPFLSNERDTTEHILPSTYNHRMDKQDLCFLFGSSH